MGENKQTNKQKQEGKLELKLEEGLGGGAQKPLFLKNFLLNTCLPSVTAFTGVLAESILPC